MLSNKEKLIDAFEKAKKSKDVNLISVKLGISEGADEHIEFTLIPKRHFDYRKECYINGYDDDLYLKANRNIRILHVVGVKRMEWFITDFVVDFLGSQSIE